MHFNLFYRWFAFLVLSALLSACTQGSQAGTGKLGVLATTTIVGDVIRQVGGDRIIVDTLLPVGVDPHTFQPNPQDIAKVAEAQVIFANGAGLEEFLEPLLQNAGENVEVVDVSSGIQLLQAGGQLAGEEQHTGGDPHTWFDPLNVITWTQNIEKKLSELDPDNAQTYAANSQKYQSALHDLDAWIQEQVAQIPEGNRKLVSDHTSLTYFAARYGFEQVGAIIPGYSTLAQPSAQELAALEDAIRGLGVKAVLVEKNINPALAQQVAQDTGVLLVPLYNGSLSEGDGPAATYIEFMKYNVGEIVRALR